MTPALRTANLAALDAGVMTSDHLGRLAKDFARLADAANTAKANCSDEWQHSPAGVKMQATVEALYVAAEAAQEAFDAAFDGEGA